MSEVIKYSLIYDYEFLDYLIENSKNILNKVGDVHVKVQGFFKTARKK